MKSQKVALSNLKLVFKNWRFSLLSFILAIGFYAANALAPHINTFISRFSTLGFSGFFRFYLTLIVGFRDTITTPSLISLITISILFGMLFSLVVYKTLLLKSTTKKRDGLLPAIGIFLGVLAPGCAACGIGLLSVLGLSAAAIQFLPFKGLELSILSIIILLFSIFLISKNMVICSVKNYKIDSEGK